VRVFLSCFYVLHVLLHSHQQREAQADPAETAGHEEAKADLPGNQMGDYTMALLPHLSEANAERARTTGNLPFGLIEHKALVRITMDHWPLLRGCFEVLCHEPDNAARAELIRAFHRTAVDKIAPTEKLTRLAQAHSISTLGASRSLETYISVLESWLSEITENQEAA
tara:strand:- start:1264 stop:1767 length:504 start_codon:yes stop_codon:yes gene_type:complete